MARSRADFEELSRRPPGDAAAATTSVSRAAASSGANRVNSGSSPGV